MTPTDSGLRRAIWGLVNDGYGLVAKTPNLSSDDAFALCRVPDIGDPSGYLDHGVAHLQAAPWGHVLARYFTNAERDSAGRASLVYDVVALSDAELAALGNDPFRALPPVASDRRPECFGALPVPQPAGHDRHGEGERLRQLLTTIDTTALATLLAAALAGDRVLVVATGVRPELLESLVLLLPPWWRPRFTFQLPTVDVPKHIPRITIAERGHALLAEHEWTTVLPRDAGDPRLADAIADATRLVALGATPERLHRAWDATRPGPAGSRAALLLRPAAASVPDDLVADVGRMLRFDQLHEAVASGDLRRAVLVTARAPGTAEQVQLAEAIFATATPHEVADALASVAQGNQRGAWPAVQAVAIAVAHRRQEQPDRFASWFRSTLDAVRTIDDDDAAGARDARVTLACGAAALGDLDRFLAIADPALPWEHAWGDGPARWVSGRSPAALVFIALATPTATYGDVIDAITAIETGATHDDALGVRASGIVLSLVRRTLRQRATLETPERLGALVGTLLRTWPRRRPAERAEQAIEALLSSNPNSAPADPRRVASELSSAIGEATFDGETELAGWIIAVMERVRGGAIPEATLRVCGVLLDDPSRHGQPGELRSRVGRALLHLASGDAAFVLRPAWLEVTRRVDDVSRRELLARALAWVARGYAAGRFTIGALADACALAGAEGGRLDDVTAALLAPHLVQAASARGDATEIALLASIVATVATPAASEHLTVALLNAATSHVADAVRMRKLAGALYEIERVRNEDRYADARSALRRAIAQQALAPDEERALRVFLGVDDRTPIARLFGGVAGLARAASTTAGEA